jgi:hypothetical protein
MDTANMLKVRAIGAVGYNPISSNSSISKDLQTSSAINTVNSSVGGVIKWLSDPDLLDLIAAWPTLPEPIRAAVLAMVRGGQGVK